jgi:cytochrome c2
MSSMGKTFVVQAVFLALPQPIAAARRSLLAGDAERGREVLQSQRCLTCHSLAGEGGGIGPDLGRIVDRGFTPASLVSAMWNHAPRMWEAVARQGGPSPKLSEQQAADLFAHFYATAFFERPGQAGRGERAFRQLHCSACHGVTAELRAGIKPVSAWRGLRDPIELSQRMWNHSEEMRAASESESIPRAHISSQDLTDLLAFARKPNGLEPSGGEFSPASSELGRKVFMASGCAACHTGASALDQRATRYSLTDFSAALWNHPLRTPLPPAQLSYADMRALVGYLLSMQFFEERGDPAHGRKVFVQKRCNSCHEGAARVGPDLSGHQGQITSYHMVAVLWKHGPAMLQRMRAQGIPWPQFTAPEMADLLTYLHGTRLKSRPAPRF